MKRPIVIFATLLIVAATLPAQGRPGGLGRGSAGPGFGLMSAWPGSRTPVTGAPYSATQTTVVQQTLANGNQIARQEQAKVYRDGQGRVRIEQTTSRAGAAQTRTSITITDPVAKTSYMLNPATKTFVKIPARAFAGPAAQAGSGSAFPAGRGRGQAQGRTAVAGPARSGSQRLVEDLGMQTIEGLGATGSRTTQTIPAGEIGNQQAIQVVHETWISSALHVPVMIKTSDPRFGATTMQLTNVVMAEPDPSLFQPPADYTAASRPQGGRTMARRPPAQ